MFPIRRHLSSSRDPVYLRNRPMAPRVDPRRRRPALFPIPPGTIHDSRFTVTTFPLSFQYCNARVFFKTLNEQTERDATTRPKPIFIFQEHHLQRAICTGLIIPTPEVTDMADVEAYDKIYPSDYKLPRQLIHMQRRFWTRRRPCQFQSCS